MYMIFVECKRKQVCSSIIQYRQTSQHFWDHERPSQARRPFWKLEIFLVELYNHYWPWNKKGEKVAYKIREKERKTQEASRSKPEKKKKVFLKKLERTQRVRGEGLERVAYDPKSVEKFGGIVE